MKPVRHRLVPSDLGPRGKSLFLSAHIGTILGLAAARGRMAFIRDLTEQTRRRSSSSIRTNERRSRRPGDLGQPAPPCTACAAATTSAPCATCAAPRPGATARRRNGSDVLAFPVIIFLLRAAQRGSGAVIRDGEILDFQSRCSP